MVPIIVSIEFHAFEGDILSELAEGKEFATESERKARARVFDEWARHKIGGIVRHQCTKQRNHVIVQGVLAQTGKRL